MKVGDVVRVKNIHLDESNVEPGFLMQILKIRGSQYYVNPSARRYQACGT